MTEEKILAALNEVADSYLEEAMPPEREAVSRRGSGTSGRFPSRRRFLRRVLVSAACICAVLLLAPLLTDRGGKAFSVKACELAVNQAGDLEIRETEVFDQPDVWGGHYDGKRLFVNVGLRYEGAQIKRVKFSTGEGFLAKQDLNQLDPRTDVSRLYVGAEQRLVMVGEVFDILGSSVVLTGDSSDDGVLLFWGTELEDRKQWPESCVILVEATFLDGSTQTERLEIRLHDTGVCSFQMDEVEQAEQRAMHDYYFHRLPLEKCQLVPAYTRAVTEEYTITGGLGETSVTVRGDMTFDENGMSRCAMFLERIPEVNQGRTTTFLAVLCKQPDGSLEGRLYAVPQELCDTRARES